MKSKRILLLVVILTLIIVGAVAYFIFTGNPTNPVVSAIKDLLPFGNNNIPSGSSESGGNTPVGNNNGDNTVTPVTTDNSQIDSPAPAFREITPGPVSGFTVFNRNITVASGSKKVVLTETPIRYIERGTGNVFETIATSTRITRLSNTTYSRIQEAFFTNGGNSLIIRNLDDTDTIKTYLADILPPNTDQMTTSGTSSATSTPDADVGSLQGYYIQDNVSFVAVSPDTKSILLATEDPDGTKIQVADTKGNNIKSIYTSNFAEWLPQWYGANFLALTSKPTAGATGLTISENIKTGATKTIVDNVFGLTSLLSPDGNYTLFSQSGSGGISLSIYNQKAGTTLVADHATLPEKCAWSSTKTNTAYCFVPDNIPAGTYPDDWYAGVKSFDDSLWSVNADTGLSTLVYDPETNGNSVSIDGIRPMLSPDEDYLVFMNKKDGSLWSLRLNQ